MCNVFKINNIKKILWILTSLSRTIIQYYIGFPYRAKTMLLAIAHTNTQLLLVAESSVLAIAAAHGYLRMSQSTGPRPRPKKRTFCIAT